MGVDVTDVSSLTNFPEMMDGRVKTLHPNVHGGLLSKRDDKDHVQSQKDHGIEDIDLIIVNLYPFEETIKSEKNEEICIENIDIGGPAMLRSAAKNHQFVTVVTDISDYDELINEINKNNGSTTLKFRKKLAAKTFSTTAYYDSLISNWFHRNTKEPIKSFQLLRNYLLHFATVKILISQQVSISHQCNNQGYHMQNYFKEKN